MDKRAPLRKYYEDKADKAKSDSYAQAHTAQLKALETTTIKAFNALINYMDGKTTKTEVTNQLKSISTPDVDKVVQALSKLDADVLANKVDFKPVLDVMNSVKREITLLPSKMPDAPEQRETVKVSNLDEVTLDTTDLEKAIKALKLDPTIEVKAPVVNVKEPDLSPLKALLLDVVKAINTIDIPEAPKTDLSTLESESIKTNKQLEESNKKLQSLIEKPTGGGGGGGHGTPYQNASGTASYVTLENGVIPTISPSLAVRIDDATTPDTTYIGKAPIGSATSGGVWQIAKLDTSSGLIKTWADGSASFTKVWDNRVSLTYQ